MNRQKPWLSPHHMASLCDHEDASEIFSAIAAVREAAQTFIQLEKTAAKPPYLRVKIKE